MSGCIASVGCRLGPDGARRARTGPVWKAGGTPGVGEVTLNPTCPLSSPHLRLQAVLILTRVQLAPSSCGWLRSSHSCSMNSLGFHGFQLSHRQPGWRDATSGPTSRACSRGGSNFTAEGGVVRLSLPDGEGSGLAPLSFLGLFQALFLCCHGL